MNTSATTGQRQRGLRLRFGPSFFCEPSEDLVLVARHPLDVGPGPLQGRLEVRSRGVAPQRLLEAEQLGGETPQTEYLSPSGLNGHTEAGAATATMIMLNLNKYDISI